MDDPLFRELFLERLPANLRVALAALNDTISLEELAERAERMTEADSVHRSVSGWHHRLKERSTRHRMRADMAELKKTLRTLLLHPEEAEQARTVKH